MATILNGGGVVQVGLDREAVTVEDHDANDIGRVHYPLDDIRHVLAALHDVAVTDLNINYRHHILVFQREDRREGRREEQGLTVAAGAATDFRLFLLGLPPVILPCFRGSTQCCRLLGQSLQWILTSTSIY